MNIDIKVSDQRVISHSCFSNNFEIFDSIVISENTEKKFSRVVKNYSWEKTSISYDGKLIGSGEDPRAFEYLENPACYSTMFTKNLGFINRIALKDSASWKWKYLIDFDIDLKPGKNWSPFVYKNEIYFVHEFNPFRVLKLSNNFNNDTIGSLSNFYSVKTNSSISIFDNYSIYRGGSNALEIKEGLFLGFGHINTTHNNSGLLLPSLNSVMLSTLNKIGINQKTFFSPNDNSLKSIIHRPFGWLFDIKNLKHTFLNLQFDWNESYRIIDPTSFIKIKDKFFLTTCESEFIWKFNKQNFRTCLYEISF